MLLEADHYGQSTNLDHLHANEQLVHYIYNFKNFLDITTIELPLVRIKDQALGAPGVFVPRAEVYRIATSKIIYRPKPIKFNHESTYRTIDCSPRPA